MAISVSIFVPKSSKLLWLLRTHFNRNKDSKWVKLKIIPRFTNLDFICLQDWNRKVCFILRRCSRKMREKWTKNCKTISNGSVVHPAEESTPPFPPPRCPCAHAQWNLSCCWFWWFNNNIRVSSDSQRWHWLSRHRIVRIQHLQWWSIWQGCWSLSAAEWQGVWHHQQLGDCSQRKRFWKISKHKSHKIHIQKQDVLEVNQKNNNFYLQIFD